MTMVIVALALSLVFVAGGWIGSEYTGGGFDGMAPYLLAFLPGLVGLALALVALGVHLIPATSGWAWLPSVLSYTATLGMLAYASIAALLSKLGF